MKRVVLFALTLGLSQATFACSEDKPKSNPFDTKKDTVEPPALSAPPRLEGPPEFSVAAEGPKVGWTYILLDKPEGKQKLKDALAEQSKYIDGKEVPLKADRPAKLAHVAEMTQALFDAGATAIAISTDSRTEFPKTVRFQPKKQASPPSSCAVVTKVLSERRDAVWTLKGGTAMKSPKGLAGPDLAMTGESLENAARRCKDSDFLFVSADDDVEWGLVYDLAAASQTLEKAKFGKVVLLYPPPLAGRPVKLD
jgi:biopolymer transport protein ExbD